MLKSPILWFCYVILSCLVWHSKQHFNGYLEMTLPEHGAEWRSLHHSAITQSRSPRMFKGTSRRDIMSSAWNMLSAGESHPAVPVPMEPNGADVCCFLRNSKRRKQTAGQQEEQVIFKRATQASKELWMSLVYIFTHVYVLCMVHVGWYMWWRIEHNLMCQWQHCILFQTGFCLCHCFGKVSEITSFQRLHVSASHLPARALGYRYALLCLALCVF